MWVPDCHLQTGTRLRVATRLYLHTGPMTTALLRVDRPFNWGIVILTDESSNDPINQIPTREHTRRHRLNGRDHRRPARTGRGRS